MLIADTFLNGESRSIVTMPMLKICMPPLDMYSINACMGSNLSSEITKSHAFLIFSFSYKLNVSVPVLIIIKDLPPVNLPYVALHTIEHLGNNKSFQCTPPLTHWQNQVEEGAYLICVRASSQKDEKWTAVGEIRLTCLLWI